jgi:hypothetical protein
MAFWSGLRARLGDRCACCAFPRAPGSGEPTYVGARLCSNPTVLEPSAEAVVSRAAKPHHVSPRRGQVRSRGRPDGQEAGGRLHVYDDALTGPATHSAGRHSAGLWLGFRGRQ